ncbi:MAG TPA: SRPBCC family protein [Gemmatimonadales bacterium]
MEVEVVAESVIHAPRVEVAAYMFDPTNDAAWIAGVVEARLLTPGPLRPRSKVERAVRLLGRRFRYVAEVMAHEPARSLEMFTAEPYTMLVRYQLESLHPGTRVWVRVSANGSTFFQMAPPLLSAILRHNIQRDLKRLRRNLMTPRGA